MQPEENRLILRMLQQPPSQPDPLHIAAQQLARKLRQKPPRYPA